MCCRYLNLLSVILLLSLLNQGCAEDNSSTLSKIEFSKIENDPDGGYRVFVNSSDKNILQSLKLAPAAVKELYFANPDPAILEILGNYKNLECVDISAMQPAMTSFEFLAKLSRLRVLGIHATAVKLPAKAELPKMEKLESLYIDCVMTDSLGLKELAANYPNARVQLFRCCNDKDLAAKQKLTVYSGNHYLLAPSNEKTSISAYAYGKEFCFVIVNLKKFDSEAIQCLTDICELRQVGIETSDMKYAHFKDILKNKAIKYVKIRKSGLSEADLNELRQEHPDITFTE